MSEHILKLIEEIRVEVEIAEKALRPQKLLANQLCERAGIPAIFTGIDDQTPSSLFKGIRRNAFYGKPLSTCIRQYLEMRENLPVKEATLDEIFGALKEGGYDLTGSTEDDQKRGVSIALGKNSQTFHRLASGDYGLVAWYSNIKRGRESKGNGDEAKSEQPPTKLPAGVPETFSTEGMPE